MNRRDHATASGDAAERRFTELYRRHHAAVLGFCLRRTDSEQDARDAAAEAFTIAWRRMADAHDPSLPWLLAIARRTLANRRRGDARRDALVERIAAAPPPAAPCPADGVHDRVMLAAAFARLSPADREVLALWAWDSLSAREAAASLGISAPAYSVRLLRARRRLRTHLEASDDGSPQRPPAPVRIDARRTHA